MVKSGYLICKVCGKEFDPFTKGRKKTVCSYSCRSRNTESKIKTNCFACKKEILLPSWRVKKYKKNYCSINCYKNPTIEKIKSQNKPIDVVIEIPAQHEQWLKWKLTESGIQFEQDGLVFSWTEVPSTDIEDKDELTEADYQYLEWLIQSFYLNEEYPWEKKEI